MSRQFRSDDTDKWKHGFGKGTDGNQTISSNTTDAPIDASCSGSSGSTSLSATNASFSAGQIVLIHQSRGTGAGNWELNKIASYSAGTITLQHQLQNTYTDSGNSQAQVIVVQQYENVTINGGVTLTGKDWDGNVGGIVVRMAKTAITVTGSINVVNKGYRGGNGTGSGNPAQAGEGTSGSAVTQTSANGNAGGGSDGGGVSNGGGGGGNGTAGSNGVSGDGNYGRGGATAGNAGLTVMVFGGAGGGGSSNSGTGSTSPSGVDGAGIVFLIAPTITVTGSINLNGTAGINGTTNGWAGMGHSGASAGGSALFKGMNITLGSGLVTANSALGGISGGNGDRGGNSGVGRIHADYSKTFSGTTSPTIDTRLDATIKAGAGNRMLMSF